MRVAVGDDRLILAHAGDVDLGEAPGVMIGVSPPEQGAHTEALHAAERYRVGREVASYSFHSQNPRQLRLSYFKGLRDTGSRELAAKEVLEGRYNLVVDPESMLFSDDANLQLSVNRHALDYLSFISREPGLHALLPLHHAQFTFQAQFKESLRRKEWKVKHAMLGFDYGGRILFVGKVGKLDVWLALAPRGLGRPGWKEVYAHEVKESSVMGERRYRALLMFLAYCLAEMSYDNVVVHERYPGLDSPDDIVAATTLR